MDDRKINRIRHYCKALRLPSWDTNDLVRYVSLYFDDRYSVEFMSAQKKIAKLDLSHIANRLIDYLQIEEQKYEEYQMQYPGTPDIMIWQTVYHEMDDLLNHDVQDAKQSAKMASANRGCYIICIFIIILLIYFFIF